MRTPMLRTQNTAHRKRSESRRASETALKKSKIALGVTCPEPIVDHAQARKRALEVFEAMGKMRT
jgi:deoxyribodipyrimidine photolyase